MFNQKTNKYRSTLTECKIKKKVDIHKGCESANDGSNKEQKKWLSSFSSSAVYFWKWFVSLLITIGIARRSNDRIRISIFNIRAFSVCIGPMHLVWSLCSTKHCVDIRKERPKGSDKFWILYLLQYIFNWVNIFSNETLYV